MDKTSKLALKSIGVFLLAVAAGALSGGMSADFLVLISVLVAEFSLILRNGEKLAELSGRLEGFLKAEEMERRRR